MILNSIRTAHCCILELLIFHPQLFSQRSAFTRSAPQISGIALHATTSLYIFFTAHALRLQMSLPFPIYHFRCCAAPAPFSAAFRIDLSIVLHMQYPWPYPQWPPPCTAPTIPTGHSYWGPVLSGFTVRKCAPPGTTKWCEC